MPTRRTLYMSRDSPSMQTAISRALRILNLEREKTERRRTLPFSGSNGRGMAAKADMDSIRPQADMLSARAGGGGSEFGGIMP